MEEQTTTFKKAKDKLLWLREMYSAYNEEEQFYFELKIVLQNDTEELLTILKARTIEIKEWYNDSLYIKFSLDGNIINAKAISYEIIGKVTSMTNERLSKILKD